MNRTDKALALFKSHRDVTNELIGKITPEQEDYQPTPTSMPAKKLAVHIITTAYKFAKVIATGQPELFREKVEIPEVGLSELAGKYTGETISLLESLSDEDWDRELDLTAIFGSKMKAQAFFRMGIDHEIHHKGQLFVYVREMGYTELPFYLKKG